MVRGSGQVEDGDLMMRMLDHPATPPRPSQYISDLCATLFHKD